MSLGVPMITEIALSGVPSGLSGSLLVTNYVRVARPAPHDQQTLCDISLLILRLTSATPLPTRFSELAVFDARLYVRVRRIDEPA